MRFETFWFWLKANVTGIGLCPTFHYLSPIRSFLVEQDRTGVRGGKHGRCSRDIRIYQPYLRNDIAFVSSDICLMLANRETSKRANKEIAGNAMKILLENDGTETYAKSTLESFWRKNYQTRLSTNSIDLERTCCTSRLIRDLCLLHSSFHLGIILWPLPFLLAIFPLERDFVSFENWDFFFRHGQGL